MSSAADLPPVVLGDSHGHNVPAAGGVHTATPPEPATTLHAAVVATTSAGVSENNGLLPSVQAAKEQAANPNVEGVGDVSHVDVANELGLQTVTREQLDAHHELQQRSLPAKPQDHSTGGLVKQHDTADSEALDKDTFNVWSNPDEVPKEVGACISIEEAIITA